MFSGIIYSTGKIKSVRPSGGIKKLEVVLTKEIKNRYKGMSIAVNGVCLTATEFRGEKTFLAMVSEETLKKTNMGNIKTGDKINAELPVTLNDFLSGHLVQGHIDTQGVVQALLKKGGNTLLSVAFLEEFGKYIVEKGSVAVDGISLTAYKVSKNTFEVSVIPETLKNTIASDYKKGKKVNLEFDIIGKYVEKQGKK
ncbi:MAG: riboflavin synthase [bacterium]